MHIDEARQILGLPQQFDRLSLRLAYRKAMMETHPDRVGPVGEERAKRVNLAFERCTTWLTSEGSSQPNGGNAPKGAEHTRTHRPPPPPTGRRPRPAAQDPVYCGDDLRHKSRGCLWSGFEIPEGTRLPRGWRRAGVGKHARQAWTQQEGDANQLWQALVDFLGGIPPQARQAA